MRLLNSFEDEACDKPHELTAEKVQQAASNLGISLGNIGSSQELTADKDFLNIALNIPKDGLKTADAKALLENCTTFFADHVKGCHKICPKLTHKTTSATQEAFNELSKSKSKTKSEPKQPPKTTSQKKSEEKPPQTVEPEPAQIAGSGSMAPGPGSRKKTQTHRWVVNWQTKKVKRNLLESEQEQFSHTDPQPQTPLPELLNIKDLPEEKPIPQPLQQPSSPLKEPSSLLTML